MVGRDASLEEIRFTFDLFGFVLLPAVLDESECDAIIAEIKEALRYRETAVTSGAKPATPFAPGMPLRDHPNTNELRHPGHYHSWLSFGGRSGALLDHPQLVPILNDLLGESAPRDGSYNFRCDDSMTLWRDAGFTADQLTPTPHGGGGQRARALGYHAEGRKIYAGSVRAVWELAGVPTESCGGTLLLPGSHKAAFPFPPAVKQPGTLFLNKDHKKMQKSDILRVQATPIWCRTLAPLARCFSSQSHCCMQVQTGPMGASHVWQFSMCERIALAHVFSHRADRAAHQPLPLTECMRCARSTTVPSSRSCTGLRYRMRQS